MELFVPANDLQAYFGGRAIVILPAEDEALIDLADLGAPVLLYTRLDRKRARVAADRSNQPDYRLQTPPATRPIIAYASDEGQRTAKSLIRWLSKADPGRDYTPLDLRAPNEPAFRRLLLVERISSRYAADNARLIEALSDTRGEVAKLRQDVEALQDDLFEQTQKRTTTAFPFRAHTVFPAHPQAETIAPSLNPFGAVHQALPCKARGMAGIDLCFTGPASGIEGTLFFDLVGSDDGSTLCSWQLGYNAATGWIHLPCKKVLNSFHVYLDLSIRWSNANHGAPPLTLADASEMREAFCRLDDTPMPNRALALRIWTGPPGEYSEAQTGPNWAAIRRPEDNLYLSLPNNRIASAKPLNKKDKEIDCVKHINGNQLQIKPQAGHISAARIKGIALTDVDEIRADIHLAHDQSPPVEFALAAVTPDGLIANAELAGESRPAGLLSFSGWQLHSANMGLGSIELPVKDISADRVDLVLATRTFKNASGACAYARWSHLRMLWRPNTARAELLTTPTRPEIEYMATLRERRERFAAYVRGNYEPLATLVCCLHRPDDIKNMALQLSHQLYFHKEIIVVINSEEIQEQEVEAAFLVPENIRTIRCHSANSLGTCLNEAVRNSNGKYILKIDADDLYFPNYVRDMVAAAVDQSAQVIGKRTVYVYLQEDNQLYLKQPRASDKHTFQTAGGTLCFDRKVLDQVKFRTDLSAGTDLGFHTDCEQHGISVFSADPYNYVYVRRSDKASHTWREDATRLLGPDPIHLGGREEIWRAIA